MRWIFAFQLVKLDSLAVYWNSSSEQYASLSNERLLVSTWTYNITTKKEAFSSKMLFFSIGLPFDNLVPLLFRIPGETWERNCRTRQNVSLPVL